MANGVYYPDIDISPVPSFSSGQALERAKREAAWNNPSGALTSTKLVVLPREKGTFALAWKTTLAAHRPSFSWLYYIDAHSGELLEARNRLTGDESFPDNTDKLHPNKDNTSPSYSQQRILTSYSITGKGDVFNTYPQPPHYFPDNQGADLYRLNGGSNDYLIGTYVDVRNESDPGNRAQGQVQNNTLTFYYAYGDSALDEVNLYYHIDKYRHEYIETDLNLNLGFTQIVTWAHKTGEADGAGFNPGLDELSFGNGDDYDGNDSYPDAKSTALEDKIIYHEYTHAVMDDINPAVHADLSMEEGAIGEGVPDYAAGAFTGRAQILNWKRDGNPSAWRDMNNPFYDHYDNLPTNPTTGEVNAEPHAGGEFFSAI